MIERKQTEGIKHKCELKVFDINKCDHFYNYP